MHTGVAMSMTTSRIDAGADGADLEAVLGRRQAEDVVALGRRIARCACRLVGIVRTVGRVAADADESEAEGGYKAHRGGIVAGLL